MDGTVLVADDDRTIRTVLTQALTRAGCKVHATGSMVTLMRWIDEGRGDLVISDIVMPDGNGLEALPQIAARRPGLPVIVISARNTIMTAIEAAEAEAYDYLPKPFDLPDLMKRSARALDEKRRIAITRNTAQTPPDEDLPLVGRTPAMQTLYGLVARVVNTDLAVLITGESGTGKSLIARTIHDFSDRRGQPFVVVGSGDLELTDAPAALLARARGGSILFDEVADLDAEAQLRVVRMLDVLGRDAPRIMASSQVDLNQAIEAGTFRQDLFYRLSGIAIAVPPLRDRVDDIPLLATHFLLRAERDGLTARQFNDDALDLLRVYTWPGNVRQLDNIVRRIVLTGNDHEITRAETETVLAGQPAMDRVQSGGDGESLSGSVARHLKRYFNLHGDTLPPPGLYQRVLREMEGPLLDIALEATGGNQAKCADLLGINRNTLRKKISDLEIRVTRRRKMM